jgi:hypothetical protein
MAALDWITVEGFKRIKRIERLALKPINVLIDDSPVTAPSKRVARLVRRYEKPLFGTLAALEIGLPTIRRECPHFGISSNTCG